MKSMTIENFVAQENEKKLLFTAGPASLLPENLTGLMPCFGRGDEDYLKVEEDVLARLKAMTGHKLLARLQGSASLSLEIMTLNFLKGRVLVVDTGYYSDRLKTLAESAQRRVKGITEVSHVNWQEMNSISGHYDWVLACYTETSCGLKLPIEDLKKLAGQLRSKLMLDATASIGLEDKHDLADVIAYSSCKGLFGLTGASFIAFNELPQLEVDSFYLNINTHLEKRVTGPYHTIASLYDVLKRHDDFKAAVIENKKIFSKKMESYLTRPSSHQPFLCTHVNCEVTSTDPRAILYRSRGDLKGSIVCHLGEAHLGRKAQGKIIEALRFSEI